MAGSRAGSRTAFATVGGADAAATLGCGFGYGQWADSGGSRAVFFVGFDKRLNRTFRLVGEGWLGGKALGLPDETLIGALRVGGGGWSVDLGVVVPVYETGSGAPFPLITIARRF